MDEKTFAADILELDAEKEFQSVCSFVRRTAAREYKRKGAVVGLSGGLDSAVTAACCVEALGEDRVMGVMLPEKESSPVSLEYATILAEKLNIQTATYDITANLDSFDLYRKRERVIQELFPDFDDSWRFQVTLPQNLLEKDRINVHYLTVENRDGERYTRRLNAQQWRHLSSWQNIKQRVRMIHLYRTAEKFDYVVAGTTNRTETEQGFFVKYGDGGVDIEPLAHLYKTQVYALARFAGLPEEIIDRTPSPDTYSLAVSDKAFYFCLDYELLDMLLYAYSQGISAEQAAEVVQLEKEQVERIFRDFAAKEQNTRHLRQMPLSAGQ